jgi:hypothetical protein
VVSPRELAAVADAVPEALGRALVGQPRANHQYEIPDGLDIGGLSAKSLETLASMLEVYGSLPFIGRGKDLSKLTDKALLAISRTLEELQIHEARTSPAAFVQYCFRHEETNAVIENAPHHMEWHEFFDANTRAILFAPVEHAKTQHIAVGRALYTLGKDPNKRLAIVSNTFDPHATKILRSIRTHIETNPRVQRVFPNLKPSTLDGDPWGQSAITVERTTIAKDPSVQALGSFGPINGSRLDGIILDDILNYENTRTPEQIQKVIGWLDAEVLTRVTEHGFINWIGTPWHPADPMHEVAKRAAWVSKRYSGVVNPQSPMDQWVPLWPSQFSLERLKRIYDGTTPINFARKYLCEVRMDSASRFQQAWIDHARDLGRNHRLYDRQPHGSNGHPWPCFTGVDLGIGQSEGHDLTVIFTIALDERKRRVVCEIQSGRWPAPEIVQRIHSAVFRFNSQVYVEDNAAQAFIAQWAGNDGLPVRGFTTTAGKKYDEHFGIESVAVELRNGGWVIPATPSVEIEAWIHEMLFYTPDSHTGDRLMASWFARECARAAGAPMFRTMDSMSR